MKNLSLSFCCVFATVLCVNAQGQAPVSKWQRTFGGSSDDYTAVPSKITMVDRDGGYLMSGSTSSTDGDISGLHVGGQFTNPDIWVTKLDSQKNILWSKCLGGIDTEELGSIELAHDDGYIIAGYAVSSTGQVTGNHGSGDAWIVRLDNSGNIVWQKCYGGSKNENAQCIAKTSDGYIFAGTTFGSTDGDVSGSHGVGRDIWVVKIDKNGVLQWQKCLGGTSWDVATDIKVTPDGGFILTGITTSNDGDVSGLHPSNLFQPNDIWVVKLTSTGAIQWQKCLGGSGDDQSGAVAVTAAGNYIVTGYTKSNDGDVSGHHGTNATIDDYDAWVVNLSANGTVLWQKCFGGTGNDQFNDLQILSDQTVVAAGSTESNDGDVAGLPGFHNAWLVKFDGTGSMIWQQPLGTTGYEDATTLSITSTGNFILSGTSYDLVGNTYQNMWMCEAGFDNPVTGNLRISTNAVSLTERAEVVSSVYPNPAKGNISLKLKGAVDGNVQVQVLDQQGRLITAKQFGEQHTAEFKAPLDLGSLSKGSYLLRIIVKDKTYMHKLLIQ